VLILLCYQIFDNHTIDLHFYKKLVKVAYFATKICIKKDPVSRDLKKNRMKKKENIKILSYLKKQSKHISFCDISQELFSFF